MPAIEVKNLTKYYKTVKAIDGMDLEVPAGIIFGLLGPNGAGKTTLVRILTTLLKPTAGEAKVLGLDVAADAQALRSMIGLAGQYAAVDEHLTGRENLELVGKLYHLPNNDAKQRAVELLEQFDLMDAADRPAKTYSGGMRRRLDLAASLVAKPKVLFLDEPTTGLDPKSRIDLWKMIRQLVSKGTTVLLTTQHLEEADQLANQIAIINHGKIIDQGTPNELKSKFGTDILELDIVNPDQRQAAATAIAGLGISEPQVDPINGYIRLPIRGSTAILTEVIRRLDLAGIEVKDILQRRPTLDDVFLKLTGKHEPEVDNL
ncbi:MAG: ATP-binding cassette domain-containing protein [Candidatus Doudnabacteria bacterium]|nr:ATP-binding cassette domain-containing protein [Candidatus Doudnabacteria bacterium]